MQTVPRVEPSQTPLRVAKSDTGLCCCSAPLVPDENRNAGGQLNASRKFLLPGSEDSDGILSSRSRTLRMMFSSPTRTVSRRTSGSLGQARS